MAAANINRLTVRDLVTLALHDRISIAVGVAIPLILGLLAGLTSPSWYESSASLLVLRGSEYFAKSPVNAAPNGPGLDPDQVVSAEAELIDNRNLLLQVIDQLGPDKIYPSLSAGDQDKALERLRSDLKVEPVFAAGALHLSLRSRDPRTAAATLQKIIDTYLESRIGTVGNKMIVPMTEQADKMALKLREAENAFHQFRTDNGISDLAGQRDHLLRLRSDLLVGQREAEAGVLSSRAELDTANAQLKTIPSTLRAMDTNGRQRELENAKASLLTLELRRKDLVSRMSESNQEVANLDLQISTVQSFIASEPALIHDSTHDTHNPAYDEAQRHVAALAANISGLQARAGVASKDVAAVTERLSNLDSLTPTFDRLTEAEHTAEESLLAYLPKVDELKIDDELSQRQSSNVRIIENATMPTRRHGNGGLYLVLGLFGSLVGGLAATFGRTSMRQVSILPSEMARWIDLPPLLVVDYRQSANVK